MMKLSNREIDRLYIQGDRDLHRGNSGAAIAVFERLQQIDSQHQQYFNIQRCLVKAYQQDGQLEKAIALCQSIAESEIASNALWGRKFLATLDPNYRQTSDRQPEAEVTPATVKPSIKLKTLAQFKQYCQDNLLRELQVIERRRKHTLKTMLLSGLVCLFLTWCGCLALSFWLGIEINLWLYLLGLSLPISVWVSFCRGCICAYRVGFKRNIIERIVDFIGDGQLQYAAHLLLEDKRRTAVALTRSQILRDELSEPDYLEQEDCVYGTIGNTSVFFSEIIAKKIRVVNFNEFTPENHRRESVLFHGLFFEAKFSKNFLSRTFVMPNDIRGKIAFFNNWRGARVKLEDPEFERRFQVYGDSQIESRYILSTNLMNRLVEFDRKAGRKVAVSFIEGLVYVAIPYRRRLFEPRLFKTMISFTPLKEYFLDLQLMIGIVEDLNLNRRIWKQH